MTTTKDGGTCRLCDSTLTANHFSDGTSYTDERGSRVCPDATDPLFMAHQPWPREVKQRLAA